MPEKTGQLANLVLLLVSPLGPRNILGVRCEKHVKHEHGQYEDLRTLGLQKGFALETKPEARTKDKGSKTQQKRRLFRHTRAFATSCPKTGGKKKQKLSGNRIRPVSKAIAAFGFMTKPQNTTRTTLAHKNMHKTQNHN